MMTTILRNPDFKNLQSQLNRIFEPFARMANDEDLATGTWVPPVDVAETQDKILVRAEVPGMKQDDIAIEFENGVLTIKGERRLEKNAEPIGATYREGVLEIEIPKKEEAKPKQIRIAVK